MFSGAYIWAKVLQYMEEKLSADVVSAWFVDVEVAELKDNMLTLFAPTDYMKQIIETRCLDYIKEALLSLDLPQLQVRILGENERSLQQAAVQGSGDFLQYNSQFTFASFIVGSSNRFAHAAALAVANNPANSYNPLFIYGPSGLGKTHLLYAIAAQIRKNDPSAKIVYIKGDQFTNEMIDSLQKGKAVDFRSKYRNADLFLVDDVQFIAGRDATQEEFFHTFNNLWENKKQIVLTADRPPNEMLKLEERLRTRFEWGLLADIAPPDYETRMAIIQNKCESIGLSLPQDVREYIAENITTNIRQIEGTVKKLRAYVDLDGWEMDVAHVSRAIKDMHRSDVDSVPTASLIISEVCRFYSIEEQILRGTQRNKQTVEARQVAMYLIRKMTTLSLPDIGREFGKDHATVIHALSKIENSLMDRHSPVSDTLHDITANINSRL